mmetsp:Transcript_41660/g.134382  ORF Transcript_41660/g.134382 Transcript_41660/m.134382 type:complete len:359 (-) Transcript_41660:861-1937(-)
MLRRVRSVPSNLVDGGVALQAVGTRVPGKVAVLVAVPLDVAVAVHDVGLLEAACLVARREARRERGCRLQLGDEGLRVADGCVPGGGPPSLLRRCVVECVETRALAPNEPFGAVIDAARDVHSATDGVGPRSKAIVARSGPNLAGAGVEGPLASTGRGVVGCHPHVVTSEAFHVRRLAVNVRDGDVIYMLAHEQHLGVSAAVEHLDGTGAPMRTGPGVNRSPGEVEVGVVGLAEVDAGNGDARGGGHQTGVGRDGKVPYGEWHRRLDPQGLARGAVVLDDARRPPFVVRGKDGRRNCAVAEVQGADRSLHRVGAVDGAVEHRLALKEGGRRNSLPDHGAVGRRQRHYEVLANFADASR